MSWSAGQQLGLDQLEEIAAASNGYIVVEDVVPPECVSANARITISLATAGIEKASGCLPLRARERLVIQLPQRFPFKPPSVYAAHKRFAGFPHVQWGDYLCLYQSPNIEYAPSDAMFGVIDRLMLWLRAAAKSELDPAGAPLHPPAVAATTDESVVIRRDAPQARASGWHWVGTAHLRKRNNRRLDLDGWTHIDAPFPDRQEQLVLAPAAILSAPLPFEYPSTVLALLLELVRQGIDVPLWMKLLRLHTIFLSAADPLYFVIGAPMRRRDDGGDLKAHLAIWRIESDAADLLRQTIGEEDDDNEAVNNVYRWAASASTRWCGVLEAREELTFRRDGGTPADWVNGKRILLLGCGAIGSHLGQLLVRANAAALDVVDRGIITPGILVRQAYTDAEIGYSKSLCLARDLAELGSATAVKGHHKDLANGVFSEFNRDDYDLVIDATASTVVAHVLETELTTPLPAPLVSMAVSGHARQGMLSVRMPQFAGGPINVDRGAKLAALASDRGQAFARAFWPDPSDVQLFQPEPGCSEPTFVGSAIDMASHSAVMLNAALAQLPNLPANTAHVTFVERTLDGAPENRSYAVELASPASLVEPRHGYRVLVAPSASKEIMSWVAQSRRKRGALVETGGLVFGTIDEALRTVWLDRVSGPPPDSEASAERFVCGVEGTRAIADHHAQTSGGSLQFIGIWHTHPVSSPTPSLEDLQAMFQLLVEEQVPARHILMVIVGHAATSPGMASYLFQRREFRPPKAST